MPAFKIIDFNKMGKFFQQFIPRKEEERDEDLQKNSVALSSEEYDSYSFRSNLGAGTSNDVLVTQIDFSEAFNGKKGRISKYREMSLFPEVSDAIDNICDEAIVEDPENENRIATLKFDEKKVPSGTQARMKEAFDYLLDEVLDFQDKGWEYFKKWLIEGELYFENILSQDKHNLLGIKVLPSFTMFPIYDGLNIIGYAQIVAKDPVLQREDKIVFTKNQITYVNYGFYGKNLIDVRGFLEASIRPYNQLRNLEDALIVYRLVRAPERRLWNINVGKLPKGKAEEYIKQLIEKYKKKNIYDPSTGAINSSMNIQALTEDYWFAKNDEGKGTEVTNFTGGTQLGELGDVNYFLQKLYKTLKLPKSRWEDPQANTYSSGRSGEITREEVKFSRFVERLQRKFKQCIMDPYITLLKMRGIDDQYLDKGMIDIEFTKSNLFKEYKEMEILDQRFGLLGSASSYLMTPGNEGNALFSKEFVLRHYFSMPKEDFDENQKLMEQEKEEIKEQGYDQFGGGMNQPGQFGQQDQFGQDQNEFGNEGELGQDEFGKTPQEEELGKEDTSEEDEVLAKADKAISGGEEQEEKEDKLIKKTKKFKKKSKRIKRTKEVEKDEEVKESVQSRTRMLLENKSNINNYKRIGFKQFLKERL